MRRSPSSASLRFLLLLVVTSIALMALPASAHAADPPPATISGTVTDASTGVHLPYARVDLYTWETDHWVRMQWTWTDVNGEYSFGPLPDGQYRIAFVEVDDWYTLYVAQYWNNAATLGAAQTLVIAGESASSGIDAALVRNTGSGHGGSISGRLTGAVSGWDLPSISVELYREDGGVWYHQLSTDTGADGQYLFTSLLPDTYTLRFHSPSGEYADAYYSSQPDLDSADPIALGEDAAVVDIDQALDLYPSAVWGTVTDQNTGLPVRDVWVDLYRDAGGGYALYNWAITDADGRYLATGLPWGDYKLHFNDGNGRYFGEWWQDAAAEEDASVITLDGVNDVANADAELQLGGIIEGTITASDSGDPLDTVAVTLYQYDAASDAWEWHYSVGTGGSGDYSFTQLEFGAYRLGFSDWTYAYLPEYHDDQTGLLYATDIAVTSTPQTIDAVLQRGGRVSGTVVDDESFIGIESASVSPYRFNTETGSWDEFGYLTTTTDASGDFTIKGLPFGQWRFAASAVAYTSEYWAEAALVSDGTSVTITDDTIHGGVGFTLARRGAITGTVRAIGGALLSNVYVEAQGLRPDAYGIPNWATVKGTVTNTSGVYTISGLEPGTYRLWFYDQNAAPPYYLPEYYAEQPNVWVGDDVTVARGQTVTNINATMSPGASISGTVRDESSNPLQSVAVRAFAYDPAEDDWEQFGLTAYTDGAGNYSITGLADDSYRIGFVKSGYVSEYYTDQTSVFDATNVVITDAVSVTGRNATLAASTGTPANGTFSGTIVADGTGEPIAGVRIVAYKCDPNAVSTGWYWHNSTLTAADGTYSMSAAPGVYRLFINDGAERLRYLPEYYDDATLPTAATHLTMTSGAAVTANASVALGGTISGTITDERTGLPLEGGYVNVYARTGTTWYWVTAVYAEADGTYTAGGLPTGSYGVLFSDTTSTYRAEYYDNQLSIGMSEPLLVDAGSTLSDINAELAPYGRVLGTVTGSDGRPAEAIGVAAYRKTPDSWMLQASAATAPDGTYALEQLLPGEYAIRFDDTGDFGFARYEPEYHADAVRIGDATLLDMQGQPETIDAQLASTGTWGDISGTVNDAVSGDPIPGVAVCRYDPDGMGGWSYVGCDTATAADGSYTLQWVPEGADYRIAVDPDVAVDGYTPWADIYRLTFHDDDDSAANGLPVSVTGDTETSGVDIDTSPEADIGYISGHVIEDGTGVDVAGATVTLWRDDGSWWEYASFETDSQGRFKRPVAAGTYAVEIDGYPAHGFEFYEDVATSNPADATTVVVSASATTDISASLEPLGSISGRVTAETGGAPIGGVDVTLYRMMGSGLEWVDSMPTASDGTYRFEGLRFGDGYMLAFTDYSGAYVSEAYDNRRDVYMGDPITVDATPETGIDAALTDAATISGVVTDSATHLPIAGAYASVYRYDPRSFGWSQFLGSSTTGSGQYTIGGLPAGTYRVEFSSWTSGHAQKFYGDALHVGDATDVPVTTGEDRTGVSAMLDRRGSISGTITNARTGVPISGAWVYASRYRAYDDSWQVVYSASTNGSGVYTMSNVTPTDYRLHVWASGYRTEYLHNELDAWSADDVTVGSGQAVTGVDEAMTTGASISGTIRDGGGAGIANVLATALRFDPHRGVWTNVQSDWTDGSGYYSIPGLADYEYRIVFTDAYDRFIDEYYDDATGIGDAAVVPVVGGNDVTGIDAVLAPWVTPPQGTVAGTVRDGVSAAPLTGIQVLVARYEAQSGSWSQVDSTLTGAGGTYSLSLPVGTYRLMFIDASGAYLAECYHDAAADYWDGADVTVTVGSTTTVNEGLARAARIAGTVTADDGGAPLGGIAVDVCRIDPVSSYYWVASVQTADDGSFNCGGLAAGDYIVAVSDPNNVYLPEYYDDAANMSDTTWVTLGAAEQRTGVDVGLATAGIIGGRLTNEATGRPAEQVLVRLYKDEGSGPWESTSQYTNDDGSFEFAGLATADYYLKFEDASSPSGFTRFETEYYASAPDLESATPIHIAHQRETADAALTSTGTWGSISGTVSDGVTGGPVAGMPVVLYYWTGSEFIPDYDLVAETAADGTYRFPYVLERPGPAPYRVLADVSGSWSAVYVDTAHPDATNVDEGDNVPLVGDAHLSGIDIHMNRQPGVGWVSGTVRSDETSAPLAGIDVEIRTSGNDHVGNVATLADGTWGRAVEPGDYIFKFSDAAGDYATEWYHDQAGNASANVVTIGTGGSVVVDEALAAGGHITGTVRNSAGLPLDTWIDLYAADTFEWIASTPASGGTYDFGGLRAGDYWLWTGSTGDYLGEYWDNRHTYGDDITVGVGQTVSGIDPVLNKGGRIGGTITSDDGMLAGNCYVTTYGQDPMGWEWVTGQTVSSGSGDWAFETNSVLPGEYLVYFWDYAGQYGGQYYHGKTEPDLADMVTVTDLGTTSVELVFDGLPPTVGTDAVASYDNVASIEITATDAVSGVASISYALDGGDLVEVPGASASVEATGWGDHTLTYWATDGFGHTSDTDVSVDFRIEDTLAPTVLSDAVANYPATATITLTASDGDGGSGVVSICYSIDGESTQTVWADTAEVEVSGIGDHSVSYCAEDNAGNTSAVKRDDFTIADVLAPTVISDAVASYDDVAVIHITATDNVGGEGVDFISYKLDTGPWVVVHDTTATVTVTEPGPHALYYTATDLADNTSAQERDDFEVVRTGDVVQVPIAGGSRYATAVEISKKAFPTGADWVVVATGVNWPDALGGSALAGALGGPILLTDANTLPTTVRDEIARLGATDAIILGGTSAVGAPVESALKSLLGTSHVERLAGANRYRTADMTAARAIAELGPSYDGVAFVATGANYPDALAAAPLSAGLHWPLFLTKATGLDPETRAAMAPVDDVLILGGITAVPPAVETSLRTTYGTGHVTRLAGGSRYATAVVVATYGVNHGLSWDCLAITTGEQFPDALAGGVLQGRDGSVMLLTPSNTLDPSVAGVLQANKALIAEVRYLGGLNALSQTVRNQVAALLD